MDKTKLMEFLKNNNIHTVKPWTQLGSYTSATYANMTAAQVNNRSSATWKTAQYVIVNDCMAENIDVLLKRWRELTSSYTGQYLFVYNFDTKKYDIYDNHGKFLFDDTSIGELIKLYNCEGNATNKIFYGVPGCGKSHYIENKILKELDIKEENKIRATFYQEYSNTDFVGQILPKITKNDKGEDVVKYIFNPGPFTLALIQAYKKPNEKVALIVEEINRGNAPAIFGDTFQLLDRKNGVSEYGIKNVQVIDYLNEYNFGENGETLHYRFDEIKIPGNMYIYATMNTSDQNVYTLDTAFTRRWEKEKIPNEFTNDADVDYFKKCYVPGTNMLWKTFATTINNYISDNLDNLQVNEDKLLGAYFISDRSLSIEKVVGKRENQDDEKMKLNFAYKVLDYLWSDVAKLDHNIIFKSTSQNNKKINTLDALISEFNKNGLKVFQDAVFKNAAKSDLIPEESEKAGTIDESAVTNG